jgi:hypothetical protein
MSNDNSRKRQVETTKKRHGSDFYHKIGGMRKSNPYLAKWASWHYWHKEAFDELGQLKPEYEEKFYDRNNKG